MQFKLLNGNRVTMGYSVLEKVEVSPYQYDTDTILADANLGIA